MVKRTQLPSSQDNWLVVTCPIPDDERWEYETLRVPRGETKKEAEDPKAELNDLAADGWRLVDTIDYTGGGTKFLVFERPVRRDAECNGGPS